MTSAELSLYVALTLIGFVFSALFSGLETGVYTLNPVRLAVRAAHRDPSAVRLRRELRRLTRVLTTLLIGNNAANYLGTFGLAAIMTGAGIGDGAVILLQALIVAPLLFIWGETLPKELFRTYTDRWTYWLSPAIVLSRWVFTATGLLPTVQIVVALFRRMSRSSTSEAVPGRKRISHLIKEGVGAGVLSESQTTLADRVLTMRDQRVANVMVPWNSVATLPVDADGQQRMVIMRSRNFTRFPVVDERGRVIGVLSWVDALLGAERPTSSLLQEPLTFTPQTRLRDAITRMRRERQRMAVVVAPQTRRPLGLVTLKDLVEPLTGKLAAW